MVIDTPVLIDEGDHSTDVLGCYYNNPSYNNVCDGG